MTDRKVPEEDLKPAFLLLSGCEADLARQLRIQSGNSTAATEHFESSRRWLQKVYGVNLPSELPPALTFSGASDPLRTLPSNSLLPESDFASNRAHAAKTKGTNGRDPDLLAELRSVKRKLDDEVELERTARRRLECRLAEVKKERDQALRMESFAQEQVKREVDSRRRAEERAEREKTKRLEAERDFAFSTSRART
jgi:hypothetical protein